MTYPTDTEDKGPDLGSPPAESLIQTEYTIGRDNIEGSVGPIYFDVHNPVFAISAFAVIAFVAFTLALPELAGTLFSTLFTEVTTGFDWLFLGAADVFVLLCLVLVISPYGKVRLGGRDARPDFGYLSWFSMLFAAGMGIGLMFYGVSEPLSHFGSSLGGTALGDAGARTDWAPLGAATTQEEAVRLGMAASIFHWALHPWAIYAVVGLSLALFSYNKGLPLTIRSAFYPIFGEKVWGWPGHVIDILAVFATLFGLATSLGLGAAQANAGFNKLFGVPVGETTQIVLIIGITAIALFSVARAASRAAIVWSLEHDAPMLGRFGHKAGMATIREQSSAAFAGDIGISTPLHPDKWGDCTAAQTACRAAPGGDDPERGGFEADSIITNDMICAMPRPACRVSPSFERISTSARSAASATAISEGCAARQCSEVPKIASMRPTPSCAAQPSPGLRLLHAMAVS